MASPGMAAAVREALNEILLEGAPFSALPLVDPATDRLPDDTMQAIADAPELSATIDGAVDGAKARYVSHGAGVRRFVNRLRQGIDDVRVLVLGDSTGNEPGEWVDLLFRQIQAAYPAYSLRWTVWDTAAESYPAFTTLVAGAGARTITVYNGSASGQAFEYPLGTRFPTMVRDTAPDLLLVNYGHNEGSTNNVYDQVRDRLLMVTESVRAVAPLAEVLTMSQNPHLTAGVLADISGFRAQRISQVAALRGYAFADVNQAFVETGNPSAYLNADLLHPNAAGSQLWADTLAPLFLSTDDMQSSLGVLEASAFHVPVVNILTNGDFASFAAPPTLPNWTANGATLSKDTTNYESPNGYAVRIQASGAAASNITQSLPLRSVTGQWITVAARMRIPAGQSQTAGRIGISDGVANVTSRSAAGARDGFFWNVISKYIAPTALYAQVVIYGDTAASAGADITVDRVIVTKGLIPRDIR